MLEQITAHDESRILVQRNLDSLADVWNHILYDKWEKYASSWKGHPTTIYTV